MELSTKATEVNDVTCNYGNLVSMATEIYLQRFAVDSIQTLYLEHMSLAITIVLAVLETLLHLKDNELHAWQKYNFQAISLNGLLVNIERL